MDNISDDRRGLGEYGKIAAQAKTQVPLDTKYNWHSIQSLPVVFYYLSAGRTSKSVKWDMPCNTIIMGIRRLHDYMFKKPLRHK